jgi:hypothetical protein
MQVTQLAPLTDNRGNIIEPAGIRTTYHLDGVEHQETRRPAPGGNVRRTIRNVITGAEETSVVPASSLPAV